MHMLPISQHITHAKSRRHLNVFLEIAILCSRQLIRDPAGGGRLGLRGRGNGGRLLQGIQAAVYDFFDEATQGVSGGVHRVCWWCARPP